MRKGYASKTYVPVERSRAEMSKLLASYGAIDEMTGTSLTAAWVEWQTKERWVRVRMPLPPRNAKRFTHTDRGELRSETAAERLWSQECRASWRQLLLVVRAKMEAVRAGISTFDNEFMAFIVLPGGRTVGDYMQPHLLKAHEAVSERKMLGSGD